GGFVGMAYCRHFDDGDGAQGFVDADTPELAVGVEPDFRGRGVGRELIQKLHEATSTAGVERMSLSVGAGNPALRLYERLGYREVRRHGDGIVMSIDLPRS
ncbi:MAG: GNAT family N-acetyltransferase, partial [bacterium]|nr:GNAT family N-acetyltransferase [bacterium]